MESTDLCAELEAAFAPPLLALLADRFGLAPDMLRTVIAQAAPMLVAALMAAGATREGAARLFAVIRSPQANARVQRYLPQLVATTAGLKALENTGQFLLERGTQVTLAALSDRVASRTGVPRQATHALTGLSAAVLLGCVKHDVLVDQATVASLPVRLTNQWPRVAPQLDDALARALGAENARAFGNTVPAQLRILGGALKREVHPQAAPAQVPTEPVAPVGRPRSARRQLWWSVGLLALLLAGALVYAQWHHGPAGVAALAQRAARMAAQWGGSGEIRLRP
ncbi:hypothetical protein LMG19083_04853 [Ralstonia psammae]|uniref:DUF937 domain-containing protein n=1 Tax=Ralstonia psammae TaxID=3058598 RepID=A0ABN9JEB4_9RALS|nr:DUF937 domain-containing protein [Ralstonia sp. LMG 19083]CAJ0809129.1 hypothetical protein LMG19083_04853 [Ralstonia sp. LMG 19083]